MATSTFDNIPSPYFSFRKYNPVEHCWGVLESHWSGVLLTDIETVLQWTKSMRWAGVTPNVYFLERKYSHGVTLTKQELKPYSQRLIRTLEIGQWSLTIQPQQWV